MAIKKTPDETIDILEVSRGRVEFYVVSESPLICNAMSNKALHQLLLPSGRKTAAEKAANLKHDPVTEFNDSIYRAREDDAPTLIVMPATAFKKAMMGAAVDIPGAAKAKIGRLLYIVGDYVPIYGIPELMMSVTRSADMNKTPDVRTRCILPTWCAKFIVEFTEPLLKAPVISKLLGAAGQMQGVGDWRVEKGSGNYGRFAVCDPSNPQYKMLIDLGGRKAQLDAMKTPQPYDSETEALLSWYDQELMRRGHRKGGEAA